MTTQIYRAIHPKARHDLPIYETTALLIDASDDVYTSCVWQLRFDLATPPQQIYCWLWRRKGDDFWQCRTLVRMDMGTDDPFDGVDPKSVFLTVIDEVDEARARAMAAEVLDVMVGALHPNVYERHDIEAQGCEALMAKLAELPFCHLRMMGANARA